MTYFEYRSFDLFCQVRYAAEVVTTRDGILAAAKRVLAHEGSAGFSVRKVAREAGISLGNLQYHFGSRLALLEGLLAQDVDAYRAAYRSLGDRESGSTASGTSGRSEPPGDSDAAGASEGAAAPSGKRLLHRFIQEALEEANSPEDLAVFRALFSFADREIVEALARYDCELYGLLEEGLAELSGQRPDAPAVHRAASLLYPALDGYPTTGAALALDRTALAELLTGTVWRILTEDRDSAPAR